MAGKLIPRELRQCNSGTYADITHRKALLHFSPEVLIYKDRRITFSQYSRKITSIAHALQAMNLKKGDGVGIVSWNCVGVTEMTGGYYMADRKKHMIISGPQAVQEALYAHSAVVKAAVISVPDEKWVKKVHARVVLKEGKVAAPVKLIDFCSERLARFKALKSLEVESALPGNPQGKTPKRGDQGRISARKGAQDLTKQATRTKGTGQRKMAAGCYKPY